MICAPACRACAPHLQLLRLLHHTQVDRFCDLLRAQQIDTLAFGRGHRPKAAVKFSLRRRQLGQLGVDALHPAAIRAITLQQRGPLQLQTCDLPIQIDAALKVGLGLRTGLHGLRVRPEALE